MEKLKHTLYCIETSPVTVIAGEKDRVNDLAITILSCADMSCVWVPNGNTPDPVTVNDIEKLYFSEGNSKKIICIELSAMKTSSAVQKPAQTNSRSWKYSAVVTELVALAETYDIKIIALLPTQKRSSCGSVYFRIEESKKDKVRIALLELWGEEWRLTIEAGANIGEYILYDYDAVTGQFTERES